ncbi:MAG: isoaspartyl peptidase/L-asparaginase [Bacteroidetes bacterium]|nr:isoaspartyl peptidase/L-asparaginase [Bacteroidota bacterium]
MAITLVIHGGAGNITPAMMTKEQEQQYNEGLKLALDKGYDVLKNGGASLDAVVTAIAALEDNPIFNAGKGSVFTKK